MVQQALIGFLTGIILLGAIVLIFRKQEDKRRKNKEE